MTEYRLEPASVEDAATLQQLINEHEVAIDPTTTPIGIEESTELLEGFFDPAITGFLVNPKTGSKDAFFSVNPDKTRERMFTDVYARPGSGLVRFAIEESLKGSLQSPDHFGNWYGVNSLDHEMKSALEDFGMEMIRTYWTMRKDLSGATEYPVSMDLVEIRQLEGEADFFTWWQLHQDSFSTHFGFAPREYEAWKKLVLDSATRDEQGCFLLYYQGEPAGFIEMGNANYHLNGGWVDSIGVAKAFQGKGFGELLLSHGVNHSVSGGRDFVELNVDTGNTSGALRLYEKLGFKAKSSWQQYENKDWAKVARKL